MDDFQGWDTIDAKDVSPEEIDAAWNAVQARIKPAVKVHRPVWTAIVVAAAVTIAVISPITAWILAHRYPRLLPQICQVSTSRGEVSEIILPDGTKVVLNAESVLVYPESFGKERSVFLSGEASFDVTSDEHHPFYVRTSDIIVKVHGTRFNVNAYFDEPSVKATLYRGVITAWPERSEDSAVTLKPNQYFAYEKETGAVTTSSTNALEAIAWESGNLCFRSASIRSVIRTLERRFGVTISLTTGQYDENVITANFIHGETLDELMDGICMIVPGMKYTRDDDRIYLK